MLKPKKNYELFLELLESLNEDAFEENVKYNAIIFTTGEYKDDNKFFISNIKLTTDIIVEPK